MLELLRTAVWIIFQCLWQTDFCSTLQTPKLDCIRRAYRLSLWNEIPAVAIHGRTKGKNKQPLITVSTCQPLLYCHVRSQCHGWVWLNLSICMGNRRIFPVCFQRGQVISYGSWLLILFHANFNSGMSPFEGFYVGKTVVVTGAGKGEPGNVIQIVHSEPFSMFEVVKINLKTIIKRIQIWFARSWSCLSQGASPAGSNRVCHFPHKIRPWRLGSTMPHNIIAYNSPGFVKLGRNQENSNSKTSRKNPCVGEQCGRVGCAFPSGSNSWGFRSVIRWNLHINNNLICTLSGLTLTAPDFSSVFSTNVKAVLNVTQICSKKMIGSKTEGTVINVSSVVSLFFLLPRKIKK